MKSKSLKAGIIALVTVFSFFVLINYMKGKNIFKGGKTLYVVYDNVNGLLPTKPVTINGMKVGTVDDIDFTDDGTGRILVKLNIKSKFEFDKNTQAVIYSPGLVSGTEVKLIMSRKGTAVKNGDYLKGVVEQSLMDNLGREVQPVKEKVERVLLSLDSTLIAVRSLNTLQNRQAVANLVGNLSNTITSYKALAGSVQGLAGTATGTLKGVDQLSLQASGLVADNRKSLNQTIDNLNQTLTHLHSISKNLDDIHVEQTVQKLDKTLAQLAEIATKANTGTGNIGLMLNDDKVYKNLEHSSKELELLLKDLKEHPKRYVHFSIFGKKDKGYQAPVAIDSIGH